MRIGTLEGKLELVVDNPSNKPQAVDERRAKRAVMDLLAYGIVPEHELGYVKDLPMPERIWIYRYFIRRAYYYLERSNFELTHKMTEIAKYFRKEYMGIFVVNNGFREQQ